MKSVTHNEIQALCHFFQKRLIQKKLSTEQEKPLYHHHTYEEISTSNIDEVSTASSKVKHKLRGDSQLALANEAILDKRVTLTDKGCWIVRGADDETLYAVRLFPKESCSCPAVKMCYHIVACKLMIRQDVNNDANPMMVLLSQKVRQKRRSIA